MTDLTRLTLESPRDGFRFNAIRAAPEGQKRGAVVVIQEIFGLSPHIEEMCKTFASQGYDVIAPSLFDRVEPNFQAELDSAGMQKGVQAVMRSPWEQVASDLQAALDALPAPRYAVGFCWGGAAAWIASARCTGLSAVSCFYGRMIADNLGEKPKAPPIFHYGARDAGIPAENVERVRVGVPDWPIHIYDAGHGFCRPGGHDYNEEARELALRRTFDWFARWRT
jgi:carboxymethylenebutenolidase